MAEQPADAGTIDPDNVAETVCIGKFNISIVGAMATLTFTHARPKTGPLLDGGRIEMENVVRARIVTTIDNLVVLREALGQIIPKQGVPVATTAGSAQLN